jgi:DNA-binding NarL/FixJ family response regulator
MTTTIELTARSASATAAHGDAYDRAAFARLTRSERRVLTLLAQGLAPKQAAWELHVAISTVRSHIASAKRKSGARTLQQMVGAFAATAAPDAPSADHWGLTRSEQHEVIS